MARGRRTLALLILGFAGCGTVDEPPLVVATSWPATVRSRLEVKIREATSSNRPVDWVQLKPGESLASVLDRRGGVDLILGGLPSQHLGLADAGRLIAIDSSDAAPWRVLCRPEVGEINGSGDPRSDPVQFRLAQATLRNEWGKGYERLVRRAASGLPPTDIDDSPQSGECVAMTRGGRNPVRAREFLQALATTGMTEPARSDATIEARADGLLADLLGAATVDALDELRDAEAALRRFGHPARAEASMGERPPWPPASVSKLQSSLGGDALIETLAIQIAPDPQARKWLESSWTTPKRTVDRAVLVEIAGAAEGRLAREPCFRAWVRGEWTAWTRQLYRRVARVAGGYVPS